MANKPRRSNQSRSRRPKLTGSNKPEAKKIITTSTLSGKDRFLHLLHRWSDWSFAVLPKNSVEMTNLMIFIYHMWKK